MIVQSVPSPPVHSASSDLATGSFSLSLMGSPLFLMKNCKDVK